MSFLTRFFKSHFAWMILVLGMIVSVTSALKVKQLIESDAAHYFELATSEITLQIQERLEAYALILQSGVAFFNASPAPVNGDQWRIFVDSLKEHSSVSGIQGIGFSKLIRPEDLSSHIKAVRAEGFPEYRVYPEGERSLYSSIIYLEPLDWRNMRAIGFDMFSEPVRRKAMVNARDTGRASLSGKVELVQETDTDIQAGTLMYLPVFKNDASLTNKDARREALIGWVYSPYRMSDLMSDVLMNWPTNENKIIGLHIYDGSDRDKERLLFSNYESTDVLKQSSLFNQVKRLKFNDTDWLLVFDAKNTSANVSYLSAWAVLLGGFSISGLLSGLMLSLKTTRERARLIANNLTQEIKNREKLLKESEFRWRFAIEGSGDGLWDWNLDNNIVFYSTRFKEMLGYSVDEFGSHYDEWQNRVHKKDLRKTLTVNPSSFRWRNRVIYL